MSYKFVLEGNELRQFVKLIAGTSTRERNSICTFEGYVDSVIEGVFDQIKGKASADNTKEAVNSAELPPMRGMTLKEVVQEYPEQAIEVMKGNSLSFGENNNERGVIPLVKEAISHYNEQSGTSGRNVGTILNEILAELTPVS